MSRVAHRAPSTLKGRDWRARSTALSNQRVRAVTYEVCNSQNQSSGQPGCPAEAFIPLHRKRVVYWLCPPAVNVFVHPLPLHSGPSRRRMCRQGRAHKYTTLLLTGTWRSGLTCLLLDKPTGWRGKLLIFIFHYFWQAQHCRLNCAEWGICCMYAREWRRGKEKRSRLRVLVCTLWNNLILKTWQGCWWPLRAIEKDPY